VKIPILAIREREGEREKGSSGPGVLRRDGEGLGGERMAGKGVDGL
jgi:hypothetical protein